MANHEDLGAFHLSFTLISDRLHAIAEVLDYQAAQSESLSSQKDSQIADLETEVQALQYKLTALHAAGLDAQAAYSKSLAEKDAEISTLRASLAALAELYDEEKTPYVAKAEKLKAEYTKKMDAYNNPQAGGPEVSGDSHKSKSEINDEEGGSENDE